MILKSSLTLHFLIDWKISNFVLGIAATQKPLD
jgi:hypothetical protein